MFSLVRVDSKNYGFVVGQHADRDAAERSRDRRVLRLTRRPQYQNAMGYFMYEIIDTGDHRYKVGTRIRTQ